MKHALLMGLFVLVLTTSVTAMVADIPLPIIIGNADRVVVGTVEDVTGAKQQTVTLPGESQARKVYLVTYTVKVDQDLSATPTTMPAGNVRDVMPKVQKIQVVAETGAPKVGGPGGLVVVTDGPAFPVLQKNTKYFMILNKFGEKKAEYFLPAYFKNFGQATDARFAQVKALGNVDNWPWGKESKGLQLAAFADPRFGGEGNKSYVSLAVAVRNTGKKAIKIRVFGGDEPLMVTASSDGKKEITTWYNTAPGMTNVSAPFSDKDNVMEIEPGKIAWIGPTGPAPMGLGTNMALTEAKWTFTATYKFTPTEPQLADKWWTGKLESGTMTVEVGKPKEEAAPAMPGKVVPMPVVPAKAMPAPAGGFVPVRVVPAANG